MAVPIWKDYNVTLAATASSYPSGLLFRISTGGSVIFQGRAYPRPGQTALLARINDICADYLGHKFYLDEDSETGTYRATFAVEISTNGSTWTSVGSVEFLNDWSYEDGFNPSTAGLAFPIDGYVDPRQMIIQSRYSGSTVNAVVTYNSGSTITVTLSVGRTADFNNDFNNDFAKAAKDYDGAAILELQALVDVNYVTIGGIRYDVLQDTCAKYALYYINAYGGWDSLVIRGKAIQRDGMEHFTRFTDYDNAKTYARGKRNYVNELTRTWELHTAWLNDTQASRMHHLLESPAVYLHDLTTDEVRPVVITDQECEWKTLRNNGGKMFSYAINVELAQDRIRR